MNALTADAITAVGSRVHTDLVFHPTSIAYVQTLLTPYAEALEAAQDVAGITAWVPLALPGRLGVNALSEITKATKDNFREEDANADPAIVAVVKAVVIECLVSETIALFGQFVPKNYTTTILPWDLQRGIGNDQELAPLLGIVPGVDSLPVTVTIGPQTFTHSLNEEFTMGLLLFSKVGKVDFYITMFGVPLTTDYFPLEDGTDRPSKYTYHDENPGRFKVKVTNTEYTFQTPDFMQGFATGAMWAIVDHHAYWSDLMTMSNQAEGEGWRAITF